jgi:hypothetical protein
MKNPPKKLCIEATSTGQNSIATTTLEFTNKHPEPKLKNYKKIQPFVFNIKINLLFM